MNFIASSSARAVETNGIASGLEQKPYAIIAVAGARVYHTKLQEKYHQWNYSRWKGTLTLGRDFDTPENLAQGTSDAEKHWFRLADVESGRTVWMFKFPENFEYELDRPFFHVFQGRTRRYGFLFNDDDEAALFGKKVMNQLYGTDILESPKKTHRQKNRSSKSSIGSISRSMISSPAPDSFRHVAHVGVNAKGVFEATKSLDPSWKEMLTQLQGHGVSEAVVMKHHDFVDGFWRGVEAIQGNESSKTERFDGYNDLTRKMTSRSGI
jgi:Wiskott-Aldrich syndrome protein